MSDIIHLLPDSVANQIAAGEVVQRPASVVKELVENSIDAGADFIQIKVVDAGRTEIQIVDNGKGMSETDARLAFERHATSKIRKSTDLYALTTMGFRGEALASVAAVAQVTLKTREKGSDIGTSLRIEGSTILSQEAVACPEGTNFSVQNLFFNTPARRKFLKSNTTELSNISSEFERIALANPTVGFDFYSGDSRILSLKSQNFKQRIAGIFGKKLEQQLIPVEATTELVNISGFIGNPESAKKKNPHQFFFVNGRYMRHPYFNKAIQSAYERLIPENEQAQFFLKLEVDPSHIDVNIHPTKTEIKFQDDSAIWQILLAAIREALGKFNAMPSIDFENEESIEIPVYNPNISVKQPTISENKNFNPFQDSPKGNRQPSSNDWKSMYDNLLVETTTDEPTAQPPTLYGHLPEEEGRTWDDSLAELFQYKGRYIVSAVADGMRLVDQTRAHVRILYERYKNKLTTKKGVSQGLLFPELIQLPPSQAEVIGKYMEELSTVGFDMADMGNGSFSVNGLPAGTEGISPLALLEEILDTALNKASDLKEDIYHRISLALAKKSALPYGQALETAEMQTLLKDLYATSTPNYTPEGKKIIVILKSEQIDKLFN